MMKKFFLGVFSLGFLAQIASAQTAPQFFITDGKTNANVLSLNTRQQSAKGGGVEAEMSIASKVNPKIWKTVITNTSSQERWLYLNWTVSWDGNSDPAKVLYWNGKNAPVGGANLQNAPAADVDEVTSMIQAIYDQQNGVALALSPWEIVSQLKQQLDYTNGKYQLHLQIPLVLDAGKSDTFPVELYQFTPRYGFLDALEKYYNAHPGAFSARSDIDPRAGGVGASYSALGGKYPYEVTRRFGGDWEWVYAPLKRTGDIYGRQEFWNYTPARPIDLKSHREKLKMEATPQAFREDRLKRLQRGEEAGAAMMYYTPAFSYMEVQLAKQYYPGSILYQPDGDYVFFRPWVKSYDDTVAVYPWGNKLSEQNKQDAIDVMKENPIPGFAYDSMRVSRAFRGEEMKNSPRRAFDEHGEYVDLSVGIAKMMDFTRDLEKDGKKMAIVGNASTGTRSFLMARSDSVLFEPSPQEWNADRFVAPLRYALGHKTITWWKNLGIAWMINWQEMTPAEIRDAYKGEAKAILLISYRYGGYPGYYQVSGIPDSVRELPLLKEVITSSWQAVPAVRAPENLLPDYIWPARYGKDLGSFITIGNASREDWSGKVLIDNDYLGEGNYLFVGENGNPLSQHVSERTTTINIRIPPHQTTVLRAVAKISASAKGDATVSWKDDGAAGHLTIDGDMTPDATTAPRSGWDSENHLDNTWNFASRYFASPADTIRNFPFFSSGGDDRDKNAMIVLPEKPSPEETWAANHIREYFLFWGDKGLKTGKGISLKIVKGRVSNATDQPLIYVDQNLSKVHADGNVLKIGSGKDASLKDTTRHLLDALDKKYFYPGVFPSRGAIKSDAEVIKKAGLAGKILE